MGLIIFIFNKIGVWLDENYINEKVYYYKIFTVIGVFISLYNVFRQVNQINKNA